jgi:hypothetical protein
MSAMTDPNEAGGVAADCYRAAGQMAGGPVREALLAMGRDYSARARATARTAAFRLELDRAHHAAPASWLARLLEFLVPATPARRANTPVRASTPPSVVAPAAVRVARPARPSAVQRALGQPTRPAARGSRLYRMHALTVPGA